MNTSRPDQPVRHDYPLVISSAGFATSLGLVLRTIPYAAVRFVILVATSLVTIVWFAATAGAGILVWTKIYPLAGALIFAVGLGGFGMWWRLLIRYSLYLVKAGYIAVLAELITKGSIGNGGEGMFRYGKRIVTERFGEVNVLFGLDLLISGAVRVFNRSLDWVTSLLPVPGLGVVVTIAKAIVRAATTYIDETIFSYNLARGDENPWRSGKDGVIYYAQNAKEILKTSVWIVVLDRVLTLLVWIVMLAPAALVAWLLPPNLKAVGGGATAFIAVLFAANVRSAFLKPVFLTMIMTRFHTLVHGQPINLEWDGELSKLSHHFRTLKEKAGEGEPSSPENPVLPPLPPLPTTSEP